MADNTRLNSGSGGDLLRTDDDGTAKHPVSKISLGVDGSFDGFVATTNPCPVELSDGTSLINVAYAEDAAHQTGDGGVQILAVRNDTLAALAGTDGDYTPLQVNASGALYIQEGSALDVSAATVTVDLGSNNDVQGAAAEGAAVSGNPFLIAGDDGTNVKHVAVAADGAIHIDDGGNTITVDGTVTANLSATDNAVLDQIQSNTANLTNALVQDDAPFTPATGYLMMIGGEFDDVGTDSVDEGDAGNVRISANRSLYTQLRDAAGNERGLNVDANGEVGVTLANATLPDTSPGDLAAINSAVSGTLTVDLGANNDVTIDGSSVVYTDDGDWTATSSQHVLMGGVYQSSPGSITDGDTGPFRVNQNGAVHVSIQEGGGTGGTSETDDGAFTAASGSGTPIMGFATADTVDSGDVGVLAMDTSRNLKVSIEADNAGIGGGTQYAEDTAHQTGDTGTMALVVRNDTLAALAGTDGDYSPLQVNASGALYVQEGSALDVSAATVTVDNAGTFAVQVDGDALTALQLIDDPVATDDTTTHTSATTKVMGIGAVAVPTDANVDANDIAMPAMSLDRRMHVDSQIVGQDSDITIADGGNAITVDWNGTAPPIGPGAETGALLVTVATDSTGVLSVDDNGGSLTVDASQLDVDDLAPTADGVAAALDTSQMMDGLTSLTPKYASVSAASSGDNTLVAAVPGKKIRVLSVFLIAASAVTARFEDGAGGTALTGQMQLAANGGFVLPFNPVGWFETTANTLLNLELSGAVSTDGSLQYVEV